MKCPFRTEIEYKYEKLKEGDGYTYFNKGIIENVIDWRKVNDRDRRSSTVLYLRETRYLS